VFTNPREGGGGDPRIFYWGAQTLVQKGLLNFFVANYFSQRRPRVFQSVKAGRRWREEYCFASRGEQIIAGYPNNNYIFEYLCNLVWWQNATRVSFTTKNQPVKK